MIFYGWKSTHIATEAIVENCPNFNSAGSMYMSVYQKYAHIYWIPFFPLSKTGGSQCTHCKQVLRQDEMPNSIRLAYENLKVQAKTPLFVFSGAAIIAAIILILVVKG